MTEIFFYHLTRRTTDRALPALLEKSLERDWRVVVQASTPARLAALDEWLWAYDAEKFLPHGTKKDGDPESQPIYLTIEDDNPNEADVRFFIEGARAAASLADPKLAPRQRIAILFDGANEAELAAARAQWKELLASGATLAYWQENEDGRFEKKLEKTA
jgi:DNA polymerase III subunit chi